MGRKIVHALPGTVMDTEKVARSGDDNKHGKEEQLFFYSEKPIFTLYMWSILEFLHI